MSHEETYSYTCRVTAAIKRGLICIDKGKRISHIMPASPLRLSFQSFLSQSAWCVCLSLLKFHSGILILHSNRCTSSTETHISSVSFHLSVQWHHSKGPGQALPPWLLHVWRLRHQPYATRLLLYRGQSVLWDPRQGPRPAPWRLRSCCCVPQCQGGVGLRWRD